MSRYVAPARAWPVAVGKVTHRRATKQDYDRAHTNKRRVGADDLAPSLDETFKNRSQTTIWHKQHGDSGQGRQGHKDDARNVLLQPACTNVSHRDPKA